jgi:hypothetical protein
MMPSSPAQGITSSMPLMPSTHTCCSRTAPQVANRAQLRAEHDTLLLLMSEAEVLQQDLQQWRTCVDRCGELRGQIAELQWQAWDLEQLEQQAQKLQEQVQGQEQRMAQLQQQEQRLQELQEQEQLLEAQLRGLPEAQAAVEQQQAKLAEREALQRQQALLQVQLDELKAVPAQLKQLQGKLMLQLQQLQVSQLQQAAQADTLESPVSEVPSMSSPLPGSAGLTAGQQAQLQGLIQLAGSEEDSGLLLDVQREHKLLAAAAAQGALLREELPRLRQEAAKAAELKVGCGDVCSVCSAVCSVCSAVCRAEVFVCEGGSDDAGVHTAYDGS